ncbi:Anoctamin-1 [Dirofilaria immitis]
MFVSKLKLLRIRLSIEKEEETITAVGGRKVNEPPSFSLLTLTIITVKQNDAEVYGGERGGGYVCSTNSLTSMMTTMMTITTALHPIPSTSRLAAPVMSQQHYLYLLALLACQFNAPSALYCRMADGLMII